MNAKAVEFVSRFLTSRVCGAQLLEIQAQQLELAPGTEREREDNELRAAKLREKAGWLREAAEEIGHRDTGGGA